MEFLQEIYFNVEDVEFTFNESEKTTSWISATIKAENKNLGELSYIFCSDEYLHKINLEHLNHDTFTDIITFNYCDEDSISGDIFISIDRVKENAVEFQTTFEEELNRVIIHGVLHLIGYNDKTDEQQLEMTAKEDFYLSLQNN